MLYPMKDLLVRALEGNYCVIAPSIRNEDCMRAALEAAEEVNSPVILSMNIGSRSGFKDGYYLPFQIAVGIQAAMRSKVPVAINCDHAPSFDVCALAIKSGMTSVMIDHSDLPFEENARLTAEVVKMAHAVGVSVEAELGHVGIADINSDQLNANDQLTAWSKLTDPDEIKRFVQITDVDCVAVSVGNKHGAYADGDVPHIDFDLLQKLRDAVPELPLVLHGGSGIGNDNLAKAATMGIAKINVGSEVEKGAYMAIVNAYNEKGKLSKPYDIMREGYKKEAKRHMEVLGSAGKAW